MNLRHVSSRQTCLTPELRRATVCFRTESIEEKVEFTTWLTAWKKTLTFISSDHGCGCCIHLFDLEGPADAIDAIPTCLLAATQWAGKGIRDMAPRWSGELDVRSTPSRGREERAGLEKL
jgi:hypothetical protein